MKEKKIRLSKEEAFKITHCPKCGGLLQSFETIIATPFSYCPPCNILKTSVMSWPYLCSECDSSSFIGTPTFSGGDTCFLCGAKMRDVHDFSKISDNLRRGYYISNNGIPQRFYKDMMKHRPCHNRHPDIVRHNENVFIGSCLDCDHKIYILIPDWMQEKYNFKNKDVMDIKTIEDGQKQQHLQNP